VSRFSAIIATLRQVIVDPTSNLTAAVLLLAAIVLVALIIVLALLLWVTGGRREESYDDEHEEGGHPAVERDAEEYEYPELSAELAPVLPGENRAAPAKAAPPAGPVTRWLAGRGGTYAIWAIVAVAVVAAFIGTSTDSYCVDACHAGTTAAKTRAKDPHKAVSCVSCHEDRGLTAPVVSSVQRIAHGAQRVVPGIHAYGGAVPAERCLTCHALIQRDVVTVADLGVRMSHKEPLAGGMTCGDCHEAAGHGGTLAKGMAPCIACHDGKKASSACTSCHVSDTSKAVRASDRRRMFPRITVVATDCGGCHDQKTCDNCHGLRMPHAERFVKWEHARYAGFEKKQVCWRCHSTADCGTCHSDFGAHSPDWVTRHRLESRASQCGCHWPRMPEDAKVATRGSFCALCH